MIAMALMARRPGHGVDAFEAVSCGVVGGLQHFRVRANRKKILSHALSGCPRSSNCGYRHPTGSGSSATACRWWKSQSRWRRSRRCTPGRLPCRADRQARARAQPAGDWYRRCCGCRPRRYPCGSRSRPLRRSPSGADPCRGSRWSTRSRPRAGLAARARWHAESDQRCARDRRRPGNGARHAAERLHRQRRLHCAWNAETAPTRSAASRSPIRLLTLTSRRSGGSRRMSRCQPPPR